MDEQNKERVVFFDSHDRIKQVQAIAKDQEVSASEIYRRAVRLYLTMKAIRAPQEATTHDHE